MQPEYFTVAEANALVPWLGILFGHIASLRREQAEAQAALQEMLRRARTNGGSSHEAELQQRQQAIREVEQRIRELVDQMTMKGIIVRDLDRGLVDFPSIRQGREVYLCWTWGEEQVAYWHETDAGFSGRQPL